jgi:DNA methylase
MLIKADARNIPLKNDCVDMVCTTLREVEQGYDGLGLRDYKAAGVQNPSDTKRRIITSIEARRTVRPPVDGRNRRSVWPVSTQSYVDGAHFATMPEKLAEPCILAGSPVGGLVLDPFCGTGTVVAVAQRLSRRGVGVDLTYQHLARRRTAQRGLMFGDPQRPPRAGQSDW